MTRPKGIWCDFLLKKTALVCNTTVSVFVVCKQICIYTVNKLVVYLARLSLTQLDSAWLSSTHLNSAQLSSTQLNSALRYMTALILCWAIVRNNQQLAHINSTGYCCCSLTTIMPALHIICLKLKQYRLNVLKCHSNWSWDVLTNPSSNSKKALKSRAEFVM